MQMVYKYGIINTMKEVIIEVLKNYAYLIAWGIIFFVSIYDKYTHKKLYKYEQRIEPNYNKKLDVDITKVRELKSELAKKIRKSDIIVLVIWVISILGCISSTITMFLHITTINTYIFNPIFFILLYSISSTLYLLGDKKYSKKILKLVYVIIGVIISFPTYYFACINQPFFWDLIIVFFTLACYFLCYKTKYKYVALLILLGLNILIVGQKMESMELNVLYDICFAIGTGLIATGIGNIFIISKNNKKIKNLRLKELDDFNIYIENVVENLFYDTSKCLKIAINDFNYINYDEFLISLEGFLKRKNSNLIKILSENSKDAFKELSQFSKELYDKKRYYCSNGIFSDSEIEEFYRIYSVPKAILEYVNEGNNKGAKEKLLLFFYVLKTLSRYFPEIDDNINQFGKDKIFVEYEVGSMKMVWPDGTKVKPEELYTYKKEKLDDD